MFFGKSLEIFRVRGSLTRIGDLELVFSNRETISEGYDFHGSDLRLGLFFCVVRVSRLLDVFDYEVAYDFEAW